MAKFMVSDRVAYSANFIKNATCHDGDAAARRGTVVEVDPVPVGKNQYVKIRWDDEGGCSGCLSCNIVLVHRIAIDAALRG